MKNKKIEVKKKKKYSLLPMPKRLGAKQTEIFLVSILLYSE